MSKWSQQFVLFFVLVAVSAVAQQVTGSGTTNTVPVFTGPSTVGNSAITQSGGIVGIGITTPSAQLDVSDATSKFVVHSGVQKAASYTIGAASNPLYEVLGGPSLPQGGSNPNIGAGGFGFVSGANQISPVIWMYGYSGQNAFRVITKGYNTSITSDAVDFDVDSSGNVGVGTITPGAKLEVNGGIKLTSGSGGSITFADGTVQTTASTGIGGTCGGDYAESVDVSGERTNYEPGDVLVIDPSSPGRFLKSNEVYSTMVAGIYSTKPGLVGRRQTTDPRTSTSEIPMAMVGIVPTKVSAENGPIKTGDLLVASSTVGRAMKGTERSLLIGAVIGKALGSLDSGTGVIEVLVTLQ